jgi:hypothetical protein
LRNANHHLGRAEAHLQFTIETRQLTQPSSSRSVTVEAANSSDALTEFVRRNESQLVSLSTPAKGRESIATVLKDDSVYLIRVYET